MKKFIAFLLLLLPSICLAQTTVTINSATQYSNVLRAGVDPSYLTAYGNQQYLKNLFFSDGGSLPGYSMSTTMTCSSGGPGQTTTGWFYTGNESAGFPANFFQNFTFTTAHYTGSGTIPWTSLGSGTITASTSSQSGTGPVLTLSPALSAACTAPNDVITIISPANNQLMTALQFFSVSGASLSGTIGYDYADLDPSSPNQSQSLVIQPGTTFNLLTDQGQANSTNPNSTLSPQQVQNIDLNGTYNYSFGYKCAPSSGSASITIALYRSNSAGSPFFTKPVTPVCSSGNAANGAGWTDVTGSFTASETSATSAQRGNLTYSIQVTGAAVKLSPLEVTEGTTLAGGNPTVFRDDVIRHLQGLHLDIMRFMSPGDWCSHFSQLEQPMQSIPWCNVSPFTPYSFKPPLTYPDILKICNFLNLKACYISAGAFNSNAEWEAFATWLSNNSDYQAIAAKGSQYGVYIAGGNEAFNSSAGGARNQGDGSLYAFYAGPNFAAFRSGAGYDSTHMKLVANGWFAPGQSYGNFGWSATVHTVMCAITSPASGCPDLIELAVYNGPAYVGTDDGTTTSDYYASIFANDYNWDSVTSPAADTESVYASTALNTSNNTKTMIYEHGVGTVLGPSTMTQTRINQLTASTAQAIALSLHDQLMIRDSGVTGPLGTFALGEGYTGFSTASGVVTPAWGIERLMPCGPGELSTCGLNGNNSRPQAILMGIVNGAIGNNSTMVTTSTTGNPSCAYAGGQPDSGTNQVLANSQPCIQQFAYTDGAGHYTVLLYNVDLSSSHSVTLSGAGAPGSVPVTLTQYPNSGENSESNNEACYISDCSLAQDTTPSPSSTTGNSYTVPAASVLALTYSTSSTPIASTPTFSPVAGTYSSTQTVSISTTTSGSTIYYTTDGTTPTTSSSVYSSPLTVSSTTTLKAIAVASGYTNSSVASGVFNINPPAVAPAFSPVGGTYTGAQTVTLSTSTSGCSGSIVWNTTGTSSGGNLVGTVGTTVSVTSTEIVYAQVQSCSGFTNSTVSSSSYTITPPAATPTFSPIAGTYVGTQTVTLSTSTSGCSGSIVWNTTGASSGGNLTGTTTGTSVTVSTSETVYAQVQGCSGFTNSAIGSAAYAISSSSTSPITITGNVTATGTVTWQ